MVVELVAPAIQRGPTCGRAHKASAEARTTANRQVSAHDNTCTEMPRRRRDRRQRRTACQVAADARAKDVARALGRSLKDARGPKTQATVSETAAVAPSTVSEAERGNGSAFTLVTWARLAAAAGSSLHAYFESASAADQPRDSVHLRAQELIVQMAAGGGWKGQAEAALDDPAVGSRSADVLLERLRPDTSTELALVEIWDWFDDVGAAFRSWDGKLARVERAAIARLPPSEDGDPALPVVSGCFVVRATRRNRGLIQDHRSLFGARFSASGRAWLRCLEDAAAPMPTQAGLLWILVNGERLRP